MCLSSLSESLSFICVLFISVAFRLWVRICNIRLCPDLFLTLRRRNWRKDSHNSNNLVCFSHLPTIIGLILDLEISWEYLYSHTKVESEVLHCSKFLVFYFSPLYILVLYFSRLYFRAFYISSFLFLCLLLLCLFI